MTAMATIVEVAVVRRTRCKEICDAGSAGRKRILISGQRALPRLVSATMPNPPCCRTVGVRWQSQGTRSRLDQVERAVGAFDGTQPRASVTALQQSIVNSVLFPHSRRKSERAAPGRPSVKVKWRQQVRADCSSDYLCVTSRTVVTFGQDLCDRAFYRLKRQAAHRRLAAPRAGIVCGNILRTDRRDAAVPAGYLPRRQRRRAIRQYGRSVAQWTT